MLTALRRGPEDLTGPPGEVQEAFYQMIFDRLGS